MAFLRAIIIAMRRLLAATLALLLVPLLARADEWPTTSPEAQGMSSHELAALVEFGIANGMDSLLVARHDKIVAEAYYAPFPANTRHRINSSTKAIIGSLVSIALKEGLLKSLDQHVLDFFPDRTFDNLDDRKKALTLQHLLNMTSGIDWNEPLSAAPPVSLLEMERSRDWVKYVLDKPMVRDPGAAFEYNSGNPHLLSAILSKVTGKSAEDYAREKLFGPLGIGDFQWRHDPQGVSTGGFGLYMLPRDMAKLGSLWLHDGVWAGQRVLADGWIDIARHATLGMGLGPGLNYAELFWSIPGKNTFMSVGYDRQLIVVMPEIDVVAVFTGAMRYAGANGKPSMPRYGFGPVIDRLKAAVKSDTALPEDPAALAALAGKVKEVAQEFRTEAGGSSPLAPTISGKVYRLLANPMQLDSLSLTFGDGKASYAYESNGHRFGGPVGLDGLYAVGGHRLYGQSAAKGRWIDDKTFQLEVQTIGNDDPATIALTFEDRKVVVRATLLNGFKASLTGAIED
jgi:CubicO group peptidase (beta-lactamase class C family)